MSRNEHLIGHYFIRASAILSILICSVTFSFNISHAQEFDPGDVAWASAFFLSAEADWKAHRWNESLQKYQEVIQTPSPFASKAHIKIGKYYKYHGRWNEALTQFEEAIRKSTNLKDKEDAITSIGAVYISKRDNQKALSIFQDLIVSTSDWQQVKYSSYWIKELLRRLAAGPDEGCGTCGQSAMKKIFDLKGIQYAPEDFRNILGDSTNGASLKDLEQLSRQKELEAVGVRLSMEQLQDAEMPLVALLEDPYHYIVVTDAGSEGVWVLDPENSIRPYVMPLQAFQEIWKGVALVFSEPDTEDKLQLLSGDEMAGLKGSACDCCPPSNMGTQMPNTTFDCSGGKIGGCTSPGMPDYSVNMVRLNFVVQDIDLAYTGRGPAVIFSRTYNSDDYRDGPFGPSWTHSYNITSTENPDDSVDIRRETGTNHRFTAVGDGVHYYSPKAVYDTLIKNPDGTFSLTLKGSSTIQHFDSDGKLLSITDRNGNAVTLQYDAQERLYTITDAVSRVTTISYGANGKIDSITDPLSRTVSFTYDAANNLESSTDMEGTTVYYEYDVNNYITAITTPKGKWNFTYTRSIFETSIGYALGMVRSPDGKQKNYYFGFLITWLADENGNVTTYNSNYDSYTTKITDALGRSVNFGYDSETGSLTTITDPESNTTTLSYDSRGNIINTTDPMSHTYFFSYDTDDNLTGITNPLNDTFTMEYDSNDNLIKITDPENGVTEIAYNSFGEFTELRDAELRSISFGYDGQGNITSMTYPLEGADTYTHDGIGRVLTHTSPIQNTTTFTYDGIDRITEILYEDQSTKTIDYDCCGIGNITDAKGTILFDKDVTNRLAGFTDVYGNMLTYDYDPTGKITAITYPGDKTVSYSYDIADRLTSVTDWLGNVTGYEYDTAGRLKPDSAARRLDRDIFLRLSRQAGFFPEPYLGRTGHKLLQLHIYPRWQQDRDISIPAV